MSALIWITKFTATIAVAVVVDGLLNKAFTRWTSRTA